MQKALVTGGVGFIGNHLVSHLLSSGIEVIVLDKSIAKPTFRDISKAKLIEGDMLSTSLLQDCLEEVDTCFHLAALASVPLCARDWIFSHENNVLAFNGLLDAVRKLAHPVKLIYASSAAVYGDRDILPLTETSHVSPTSTYGADKLSNEIYAEALSRSFQIPSIGLRLFNVYGPGQPPGSSYSGVITLFMNAIQNNQAITIFGDGKQSRDFIYIDDIVDAFMAAAATPMDKTGIYNVCRGESITILSLAELMMQVAGNMLPIIHAEPRIGDLRHSVGDNTLATKELNFVAKTTMETGLRMLMEAVAH